VSMSVSSRSKTTSVESRRMRRYLVPLLLAACGRETDADARLAARRAALGLDTEPVPFADAMKTIEKRAYEAVLMRVGSKGLSAEEVLDVAVEVENLLARADPATAAVRPPDPLVFDARLKDARARAAAFARAALDEGAEEEARALVASCVSCHVTFRTPR
jgi:hypothetical protein